MLNEVSDLILKREAVSLQFYLCAMQDQFGSIDTYLYRIWNHFRWKIITSAYWEAMYEQKNSPFNDIQLSKRNGCFFFLSGLKNKCQKIRKRRRNFWSLKAKNQLQKLLRKGPQKVTSPIIIENLSGLRSTFWCDLMRLSNLLKLSPLLSGICRTINLSLKAGIYKWQKPKLSIKYRFENK